MTNSMTHVQQRSAIQLENTLAEISKFEVEDGVTEFHVMIHATHPEQTTHIIICSKQNSRVHRQL